MAKRGRPNVYEAAGVPDMKTDVDNTWPDDSERGKVNHFYTSAGLIQFIHANEKEPIPNYEKIINRPGCILEQLGRMEIQAHFPDDLIQEYARQAGEALSQGMTQKEVAESLRQIRLDIIEEMKGAE